MGLDLRFCFTPFIQKKIQFNICGNVVVEDKMEFQNGTELKDALSLKLLKEQAFLVSFRILNSYGISPICRFQFEFGSTEAPFRSQIRSIISIIYPYSGPFST
jgi:hypothetical protein